VSAYVSLAEMWREWGRSFDLKDATPMWRRWLDVALVWSAQALPLPMLVVLLVTMAWGGVSDPMLLEALLLVNASALCVRLMMLAALRGSYAERGWPFWLSWLSDIAAAWRLTLSTARTPTRWRGRQYDTLVTDGAN
jgi:dolichol-phosphate mannosyltransferase